ncbi:MAG: mercury resistance system transport protein MerF [Alphaproteobacteria bacterium]
MSNKLFKVGLIGSLIAAICCFTPALVVALGAIGLTGIVAYLDILLLPALALFLGITAFALWKRKQA